MARGSQSRSDVESGGEAPLVLTIGHSTRPIGEFIDLLRQNEVDRLVDVRTIPRSRHNPQFSRDALGKSLRDAGIEYAHIKELGGLRHPRRDSVNTGWRNASFRGYADYMQTDDFSQAVDRLLGLCGDKRCAVMCAEAVPWRCHRSLLADALLACGIAVEHIMSGTRRDVHTFTAFAQIHNGKVVYPKTKQYARRGKPVHRQAELKFDEAEAAMPSKRRKTKFSAAKEARRRARLAAGTPPRERVIPDKRQNAPKHKKSLKDLADM